MVDIKKQVISALGETGLPAYFDSFETSDNDVPCITYIEYKNNDNRTGDTLGYSDIGYTVTVWAKTVEDLMTYSLLTDTKMRALGFRRRNSAELANGNLLRKVSDYEITCREEY